MDEPEKEAYDKTRYLKQQQSEEEEHRSSDRRCS